MFLPNSPLSDLSQIPDRDRNFLYFLNIPDRISDRPYLVGARQRKMRLPSCRLCLCIAVQNTRPPRTVQNT